MADTSRFGLSTPVVTLNTGRHSGWEATAGIEDIATIAQAADRLGYHHITCSEHVGIPSDVEAIRGGRYYDPLATFGYLASCTSQLRFMTYVLVLAYSHPLEIAKRYGTLDLVTGGRVELGVGVGSLHPEFELLGLGGVEFEQRGERGDDAIRAIRTAWGKRLPEYEGKFYQFSDFIIDPCAPREEVNIWIGGRSMRSLRRAAELGDGWTPFGLSVEEMGKMIAAARELPAWQDRARPIECSLRHNGLIDPVNAPEEAAERIRETFTAGATIVNLGFVHSSRQHFIEQLEAASELAID